MNKVAWTKSDLPKLGKVFLRNVLSNIRADDAEIKFGETGTGQFPNYQISYSPRSNYPEGVVMAYRGMSHDRFEDLAAFNSEKISQPFSRIDIEDSLELAK